MKQILIIMLIIFMILLVGCSESIVEECEKIAKMDYNEYDSIACDNRWDRIVGYDCTCYSESECREHSCSNKKQRRFIFDIK